MPSIKIRVMQSAATSRTEKADNQTVELRRLISNSLLVGRHGVDGGSLSMTDSSLHGKEKEKKKDNVKIS
jgi:hypothetical protein